MALRLVHSLQELAAEDWDALHDGSNPLTEPLVRQMSGQTAQSRGLLEWFHHR